MGVATSARDPGDLLSVAVTGRLKPASYQAAQPDKPGIRGLTQEKEEEEVGGVDFEKQPRATNTAPI